MAGGSGRRDSSALSLVDYLDLEEESQIMETSDLVTISSLLVSLRKDVGELKRIVGSEISDLKKAVARISACTDCIVASVGTASTESPATKSRVRTGPHLLLPANNVFSNDYVASGVCSVVPHFIYQSCLNQTLTLDAELPLDLVSGIMFSLYPTNRKSIKATPARALHSDLKLLVLKLLVQGCRSRARTVETPQPLMSSGNSGNQPESSSQTETMGSVVSHGSVRIEVEWMRRGYVREEVFEEVRREIDGGEETETQGRGKKRKLQEDAELRDCVSRDLLKVIYPKIHSFFHAARAAAKKQFFQDIGFIMRSSAEAVVDFGETSHDSLTDISDVEMTYPRAQDTVCNDAENQRMYDELNSSHAFLQVTVQYSVKVKYESRRSEKKRINKEVHLVACAQNFCVTFLHLPARNKFWRLSVHSLRLVYVVALAFRRLLVEYEEYRTGRSGSGRSNIAGDVHKELQLSWAPFLFGDQVADKRIKDGILVMTEAQYAELSQRTRRRSPASSVDDDDDDDDEEGLDNAGLPELRMI